MLNNRFSFEENPYIYLEFYFTGAAKFLCISVSILVYMLLLELLDLLREWSVLCVRDVFEKNGLIFV